MIACLPILLICVWAALSSLREYRRSLREPVITVTCHDLAIGRRFYIAYDVADLHYVQRVNSEDLTPVSTGVYTMRVFAAQPDRVVRTPRSYLIAILGTGLPALLLTVLTILSALSHP